MQNAMVFLVVLVAGIEKHTKKMNHRKKREHHKNNKTTEKTHNIIYIHKKILSYTNTYKHNYNQIQECTNTK